MFIQRTLIEKLSIFLVNNISLFRSHTLAARGLDFFSSCAVVLVVWFLAGNRFWCYLLTYLEYNIVVALCWFFGSGRK